MTNNNMNNNNNRKRRKSDSASPMEDQDPEDFGAMALLNFFAAATGNSSTRWARVVEELNGADPEAALLQLNDLLNMSPEEGAFGFPVQAAVNALLRLIEFSDHAVLAAQCLVAAVDVEEEVAELVTENSEILKRLTENFLENFDLAEQMLRLFCRLVSRGHGDYLVESEIFTSILTSLAFFDLHNQISLLHAVRDAVAQHGGSTSLTMAVGNFMRDNSLAVNCFHAALQVLDKTNTEILLESELYDLMVEQISEHTIVVGILARLAGASPEFARKLRASEAVGNFASHRDLAVALLPDFKVDGGGSFQVASCSAADRKFVARLAAEISDHPKINLLQKLVNGDASSEALSLATEIFVCEVIAAISGRGWTRSETLLHALGILVDLPSDRLVKEGVAAAAKALTRKFSSISDHRPVQALCERIVRACEGADSEIARGNISDLAKFTPHQILSSDAFVESCLSEISSSAISDLADAVATVRQCVARAHHAVPEPHSLVQKITDTSELVRLRLVVRASESFVVAVDPRTTIGNLSEEISERLDKSVHFRDAAGKAVPAFLPVVDAVSRKFPDISDLLVVDEAKAAKWRPAELSGNFWATVHTLHVVEGEAESPEPEISDSLANIVRLWKCLVSAPAASGAQTGWASLVIPELSAKIGNYLTPELEFLLREIPFAFEVSVRKRVLLGTEKAGMRQRLNISRTRVLEETLKALPSLRPEATLEISFRGEAGSGSGPANEFFSLVSEDFRKLSDFFRNSERPLFPSLKSGNSAETWKLLGWICGRALRDGRVTELDFDPLFWATMRSEISINFRSALKLLDPEFAQSLEALLTMEAATLKNLEISCKHVPGAEEMRIAKLPGKLVTRKNVERFVDRVADISVFEGVKAQRDAFMEGIGEIVDLDKLLALFSDTEISGLLFNGSRSLNWTRASLESEILATNGYGRDSRVVGDLFEILCDMENSERSDFVRFVTGARRLPVGGLSVLKPQLTVVKAIVSGNPDTFLPSVMTCAHFLKLPEYSSKEALRRQLVRAITDGQSAFHLS